MKTQHTKDNWNANLYDDSHSFVSKYGNSLLELLAVKHGEKILDLGCGTGDLSKCLSDAGANVIGVDNSHSMVTHALSKYPTIDFEVRDVTKLGYHSEFDGVFSNAVLHWVKKPREALECIYTSLKPGGRFVAEFGSKGNVQLITDEIIHQLRQTELGYHPEHFPWYFPSVGEYTSLMEEVGYRVTFAENFDRPTPLEGENGLKNWINMFAGKMFEDIDEDTVNHILANVENNLKGILYKDGIWFADYKRIRVIGIKE